MPTVMRAGAVAIATIVVARAASAEPSPPSSSFEASGFVGFGWFSADTELGNSWAPEQVPNTAPVVGGRLGWLAIPALVERGKLRLQLAVEAELSIATAFTGSSFSGGTGRMSYFAPVFGWRAHASLRFSGSRYVRPHLIVGGGGETIASSSPFMSKETDPVVYWGPGVTVPVSERWQARVDLRHGIMAARTDGTSSTVELQFGVATSFGAPTVKRPAAPPESEPPVITLDDTDTDEDGLPDRLDACPSERETVNGVDDGDGCAEVDPDGDGIIGAADACPGTAEDLDRFADEDGCPELDNEHDGIEDVRDVCPLEPETRNGIDDDDGCPDAVPDEVTQALGVGARVRFEPNRARITAAAKQALQPLRAMLEARQAVHITIIGHPEHARGEDLANRRAEAVKWFLVDAGIVEGRIETKTGTPGKPLIELVLGTAAHQ